MLLFTANIDIIANVRITAGGGVLHVVTAVVCAEPPAHSRPEAVVKPVLCFVV